MEIRIKTGDDLRCDYTRQECPVLVKLMSEEYEDIQGRGRSSQETLWMGRKALEDALKILDSMEGKVPAPQMMTHRAPAMDLDPESAAVARGSVVRVTPVGVDPKPQIDAFAREIANLAANPPKSRDNEKEGLSEGVLREVIFRYRNMFRHPLESMAPVLQQIVGMPKERLEVILKMNGG